MDVLCINAWCCCICAFNKEKVNLKWIPFLTPITAVDAQACDFTSHHFAFASASNLHSRTWKLIKRSFINGWEEKKDRVFNRALFCQGHSHFLGLVNSDLYFRPVLPNLFGCVCLAFENTFELGTIKLNQPLCSMLYVQEREREGRNNLRQGEKKKLFCYDGNFFVWGYNRFPRRTFSSQPTKLLCAHTPKDLH